MAKLYNDIWTVLKQRGECKVAARPDLHKRIIHAVINKKYYDTGYKFLLAEEKKTAKLFYTRTNTCIEFKLVTYVNLRKLNDGDI